MTTKKVSYRIGTWRQPLPSDKAGVPRHELLKGVVNRESLFPDTDDLQHAQVLELIQDQLLVVGVGGFGHVGLDATDVPVQKRVTIIS